MKKILSLISVCLLSLMTFAQKNTLLMDGNTYQTIEFTFTSYVSYGDDRLFPDKDIDITIGKRANANVLQIDVKLESDKDLCDYFHKCGIYGDLKIELSNGETIVCKDNHTSDFHDNMVSALYTLTSNDMETLKKNNIEIVQFFMQTFSTKGNYIAANFYHFTSESPDEFTKKKEKISTTKVYKLVRKLK